MGCLPSLRCGCVRLLCLFLSSHLLQSNSPAPFLPGPFVIMLRARDNPGNPSSQEFHFTTPVEFHLLSVSDPFSFLRTGLGIVLGWLLFCGLHLLIIVTRLCSQGRALTLSTKWKPWAHREDSRPWLLVGLFCWEGLSFTADTTDNVLVTLDYYQIIIKNQKGSDLYFDFSLMILGNS